MNRNATAAQVTSAKCDLRNEQQVEKKEESREMKDWCGDIGLLSYFVFVVFRLRRRVYEFASWNQRREQQRPKREEGREQGDQIPLTTALRS